MIDALVAFGSNQGDSQLIYDQTIERLAAIEGVFELRASEPVFTSPVTGTLVDSEQTKYLNSVFRMVTSLDHQMLLEKLLGIEQELGRIRINRWDARTVDLDLLIYGDWVLDTPTLVVPHPRMSFRRFVLEPAVEIAPKIKHPVVNCTLQSLLDRLDHPSPSFAMVIEPDTALAPQLIHWRERIAQNFPKWDGKKNIFETQFFSCMHSNQAKSTVDLDADLMVPQRMVDHWRGITLLIVIAEIDARNWIRVKNRFAGPTLLLRPSLGWSKIETEINAALESAT